MSWSSDLFTFWEIAPEGAFLTMDFPRGLTAYDEGCCMHGIWTITKLPTIYMFNFRKEDNVLVIPPIGQHIEAAATSPTSQYTYHLTHQAVREILEWAERQGLQPKAQGHRQLEAAPTVIQAGS